MRLSVAIPTRNGAKYLPETLASIVGQSRLPDELVISDDASQDDTIDQIERFAQTAPFAVRVVPHTPNGITANYLNAFAQTSGDIVVFSDQDDVWLPTKLALIEQAFQSSSEIAVVSSDSEIVHADLRPTGRTLRGSHAKSTRLAARVNARRDVELVIRGLPLLAHTLAVRSECRQAILNKPASPPDWWFESWVSMAALSVGRLALLPEALTLYRQHSAQAAGAPAASVLPLATRDDYRASAERFRYIAHLMQNTESVSLLSSAEADRRKQLIESYVAFVEHRGRLLTLPKIPRLNAIATAGTVTDYLRFTSGVKSIVRDCLRPRALA